MASSVMPVVQVVESTKSVVVISTGAVEMVPAVGSRALFTVDSPVDESVDLCRWPFV